MMTTEERNDKPTLRDIAKSIRLTMQCNCDLDNWEPEPSTGHSHVCRIHNAALATWRRK